MIGIDKNSLPYQEKIMWDMLRYIRLCRNLSQEQFGDVCKIDRSTLAKIERNETTLSPLYESKILEGCRTLGIKDSELNAIKTLLKMKITNGGYDNESTN